MTLQGGDEISSESNRRDPLPDLVQSKKDPWSKYPKVRKVGRIENKHPSKFFEQKNAQKTSPTVSPSVHSHTHGKSHITQNGIEQEDVQQASPTLAHNQWRNQIGSNCSNQKDSEKISDAHTQWKSHPGPNRIEQNFTEKNSPTLSHTQWKSQIEHNGIEEVNSRKISDTLIPTRWVNQIGPNGEKYMIKVKSDCEICPTNKLVPIRTYSVPRFHNCDSTEEKGDYALYNYDTLRDRNTIINTEINRRKATRNFADDTEVSCRKSDGIESSSNSNDGEGREKKNSTSEGGREGRVKKDSVSVSIHEEIRKSFSRTRSLSVTMLKNIFKKSKTFHSSSDTLISSRTTNAADAIIPNFIFKYHTEDVDDPLPQSAKGGRLRQCYAAISMGMNTLVCGILLGLLVCNNSISTLLQACNINLRHQALLLFWLKYVFVGGCFVSCLFWWQVINYIGRKVTNLLSTFLLLVSFMIFLVSEDSICIVLSFVLGGICCSNGFINSYFYLPECVEEKMFMPTSVIFSSMMFIGMYVTQLVLMCFTFHCLVYVSITFLFLSFVLVSSLPESPAFYFKKNDVKNAHKSITWFKDRKNELLVSYEMTIVLSKFTEKNKSLSWSCFSCKANMHALYLSLVLMFATALNTSVFFKLYPTIGNLFTGNLKPFVVDCSIFILPISILVVLKQVIVNTKRKKLLVTSYSLLTISLVLLSIFWNFVSFRRSGEDVVQMFVDWLILLSFGLFTVSFLLSSFIIPHVLYFEIFSHETMSSCLSVLYGFGSLLTLGFIFLSPYVDFVGFGTSLFIMSIFFLILIKLITIYLPETKDENFSKIRKRFRRIKNLQKKKKVSIFTIGDGEIDV
uniref:Facilitated trehalose transporter Tret1 n=1 Tax=Cacopsylla melanoneura TaxID=428564 RepID=A0A8D8S1Z0_9HEMI